MEMPPCLSVTELMESYLASGTFDGQLSAAFSEAQRGGGSHDRNISPDVLRATIAAVQRSLPAPLSELPEADATFVESAIASVLPDLARSGVADRDEVVTAVQVVLLQLAAATDKLAALVAGGDQRTTVDGGDRAARGGI
jgi:hypothetical protein